jgi:hypothetical protein
MKLGATIAVWFSLSAAALAADKLPAPSPDNVVIAVSEDRTILWNGSPVSCDEMHKGC